MSHAWQWIAPLTDHAPGIVELAEDVFCVRRVAAEEPARSYWLSQAAVPPFRVDVVAAECGCGRPACRHAELLAAALHGQGSP